MPFVHYGADSNELMAYMRPCIARAVCSKRQLLSCCGWDSQVPLSGFVESPPGDCVVEGACWPCRVHLHHCFLPPVTRPGLSVPAHPLKLANDFMWLPRKGIPGAWDGLLIPSERLL